MDKHMLGNKEILKKNQIVAQKLGMAPDGQKTGNFVVAMLKKTCTREKLYER
jgi:hypothetical protein